MVSRKNAVNDIAVRIKNHKKDNKNKQMVKYILTTIAIAIFSALLIAYAYDISNGEEIPKSSSRQGVQDMVVFVAKILGVTGSWILCISATTASLWYTIDRYKNEKRR